MQTPIKDFQSFLNYVDIAFASYFLSMTSESDSIRRCFCIYNEACLIYSERTKLRFDIKEKVILKHKKLFGNKSQFISRG
jgi:hypothetical protein